MNKYPCEICPASHQEYSLLHYCSSCKTVISDSQCKRTYGHCKSCYQDGDYYKPKYSDILWDDDELRVYVKEQETAGSMFTALSLINIGLKGAKDSFDFFRPADANRVIDDFIKDLQKIKSNYST